MNCTEKLAAGVILTLFAVFVFAGILLYQVDDDDR